MTMTPPWTVTGCSRVGRGLAVAFDPPGDQAVGPALERLLNDVAARLEERVGPDAADDDADGLGELALAHLPGVLKEVREDLADRRAKATEALAAAAAAELDALWDLAAQAAWLGSKDAEARVAKELDLGGGDAAEPPPKPAPKPKPLPPRPRHVRRDPAPAPAPDPLQAPPQPSMDRLASLRSRLRELGAMADRPAAYSS